MAPRTQLRRGPCSVPDYALPLVGGGAAHSCGTATAWGGLEREGIPHGAGRVERRQRAVPELVADLDHIPT